MLLPQLTDETFDAFVSSNPFVVVHCWAAWNVHDRTMRTAFADQLAYFPDIAFAELDVDAPGHCDICRSLNVHGPPFLALYRQGNLVTTRVGLMERSDLRVFLSRLLAPPHSRCNARFYADAPVCNFVD